VFVGPTDQGCAQVKPNIIYNTEVFNKMNAKVNEIDQNIIIVSWAAKSGLRKGSEGQDLQNRIKSYKLKVVEGMQQVSKPKTCQDILQQLLSKKDSQFASVSFMFTTGSGKNRPFRAGFNLSDCSVATVECKANDKMLSFTKDFEICFGVL